MESYKSYQHWGTGGRMVLNPITGIFHLRWDVEKDKSPVQYLSLIERVELIAEARWAAHGG